MAILQDIFPDKAMERKILSLAVKCSSDGCEWIGELRYKEVKLTSWSYSHWKVNNLVMKIGTNIRTNWTHKMYCQRFTKSWTISDFNHVTICIVFWNCDWKAFFSQTEPLFILFFQTCVLHLWKLWSSCGTERHWRTCHFFVSMEDCTVWSLQWGTSKMPWWGTVL